MDKTYKVVIIEDDVVLTHYLSSKINEIQNFEVLKTYLNPV